MNVQFRRRSRSGRIAILGSLSLAAACATVQAPVRNPAEQRAACRILKRSLEKFKMHCEKGDQVYCGLYDDETRIYNEECGGKPPAKTNQR